MALTANQYIARNSKTVIITADRKFHRYKPLSHDLDMCTHCSLDLHAGGPCAQPDPSDAGLLERLIPHCVHGCFKRLPRNQMPPYRGVLQPNRHYLTRNGTVVRTMFKPWFRHLPDDRVHATLLSANVVGDVDIITTYNVLTNEVDMAPDRGFEIVAPWRDPARVPKDYIKVIKLRRPPKKRYA